MPTITEAGDYQVEVHFVTASDRRSKAPYTVVYDGGSKTHTVDPDRHRRQGDWVNAPSTNFGFMVKAVDEAAKSGRGRSAARRPGLQASCRQCR